MSNLNAKEVIYKSVYRREREEMLPLSRQFNWYTSDSASRIMLISDRWKVPKNQSADLTLPIPQHTLTKFAYFRLLSGNKSSSLKVRINGNAGVVNERLVSPRYALMDTDIDSLVATNVSTTTDEYLELVRVVVVGDVSTSENSVTAIGARTFLELTDTPSSYSGAASKYPKVNSGGTGLEFVDLIGDSANTNIESISSSQTLTATQVELLVDTSGGDVTLTLPNSSAGREYRITNTGSAFNKVILSPASGVIKSASSPSGAATYNISNPFEYRRVITDGTDWYVR